jgi:wobble nucleotide-excising tRNase
LCWINDGSHCISDDFFIEDQGDVMGKYFDVLKNIFNHTYHLEHYEMMMREEIAADKKE